MSNALFSHFDTVLMCKLMLDRFHNFFPVCTAFCLKHYRIISKK